MILPSGTVTLLFTDIEGSTRLWEEHPDAMRLALARHDELLRQAIEDNNGVVFKTIGDAFCAAFATAPDALNAALAAQVALHSELWPDAISLRVRMALHTGTAELRDNDYFGQPLNRVARLLVIGYGGQALLSEATHAIVGNSVPLGASLRDMGVHRLKDLQQPEQVWQLCHPDLPATFPPLRSLNLLLHNLPIQTTSFIGREQEIVSIKALLATTRLLTLTGSGGTGKTRLMLQVAAEAVHEDDKSVWLVELAPLADPLLVPQAVASVLNVREEAGRPLMQTLTDALKSRKLLLLLDNSEHLLPACAHLADALLKNCPDVKIMASSREPLGVAGEQTYRVPSLSLPPILPSAPRLPAQTAHTYEAVRLFADRAMLVKPEFLLTDANAPVVAQVCQRLDGIPLAVELAAARVRSLPVEQIATRLDDRFRLLTGGSRTALPRQQTLRALVEWSYDLLSVQEKMLLHRLAVFAGGWTLEAAEAVCSGDGIEEWEVLDLLTSLVDKSLVIYDEQEEQARYRLLETVRAYALERLKEIGEEAATRSRHLEHFLHWAEAIEPRLHGAEQVTWLNRLEREHDNLRAALTWSQANPEMREKGLRLAGALYWFWQLHSHLHEGGAWLQEMLTRTASLGRTRARATALQGAGQLANYNNNFLVGCPLLEESASIWRELDDKRGLASCLVYLGGMMHRQPETQKSAIPLLHESVTLSREVGDPWGLAMSLWMLGTITHLTGDDAAALPHLEESATLFRQVGDPWGLVGPLFYQAEIKNNRGEYTVARAMMVEALSVVRRMGDKWRISVTLDILGETALAEGNYQEAQTLLEESLTLCREMNNTRRIAHELRNLGHVARFLGEYTKARAYYTESLRIYVEAQEDAYIAHVMDGLARLAASEGQSNRAARLFGFVARIRQSLNAVLPGHERRDHEHNVMAAQEALGEQAFSAAWAEGSAMTLEQAIECALMDVTI